MAYLQNFSKQTKSSLLKSKFVSEFGFRNNKVEFQKRRTVKDQNN